MGINAKTLVKDRFWIIEEDGTKLGTLQKQENNGWIFLGKTTRMEFPTIDSLYQNFGDGIFANDITLVDAEEDNESTEFEVHGFACNQKPYNPMFNVKKQLPIYTKTSNSKSLFCAGYYIICFEKGWRKAYCPKLITLQRYEYKGPMKTKLEMQQVLNNAIKEQNTDTTD